MNTIAKKVRQFNKIFTKEEKAVIILGSIATLLFAILGLMILTNLVCRAFNWYIELIAEPVVNALNNLVGALFPGWKLM